MVVRGVLEVVGVEVILLFRVVAVASRLKYVPSSLIFVIGSEDVPRVVRLISVVVDCLDKIEVSIDSLESKDAKNGARSMGEGKRSS